MAVDLDLFQSHVLKNRNITNNITSQCARGEEGKIRSPLCAVLLYVFTVLSQPFSDFPCHHITHPWSLSILCSLFNAFTDGKSPATSKMSEHPIFASISIAFHFPTNKHKAHRGRQSIRVIMGLKHLKASGHPDTRQCKGPEEQGNITLQFLKRIESLMCFLKCLEGSLCRFILCMHT